MTRFSKSFTAALICLGSWGTTPAFAEEAELEPVVPAPPIAQPSAALDVEYTAHVGGFRVGVIKIDAQWNDQTYSMASKVNTEGLADLLVKARYHNTAHGLFVGSRVAPLFYTTHYKTRSDEQRVHMTFSLTEPLALEATPPYTSSRPVSRFDKRKSVDPMSSIIHLIVGSSADEKAPCGRKVPIFDGKRRYDFKLKYVRDIDISAKTKDEYAGPGVHCQLQYAEIAGFRPRDPGEKPYPWVDVFMASLDEGAYMVPVRLTADTDYGAFIARLTKMIFQSGNDALTAKPIGG